MYSTLLLTLNVDDLFFVVRTCGKLPTPWGCNHSQSSRTDIQFSRLCRFSTNGISLRSGEVETHKKKRSRQANFLGTSSPDSFPTDRFAPRRSREWLNCKDEPSCSQANSDHITFVTVILLILIGHVRTVHLTVETSEFRWWQSSKNLFPEYHSPFGQ